MRNWTATSIAALLALSVLYVGMRWGSTVGGGADSAGYIIEAGLWRAGGLTVHQDVVAESEWPLARNTWTPLGFVPSASAPDGIVPSYAPGYPLLIALAQLLGGYCAGFFVVPLCGALAVSSTFLLGRRVFGNPLVALGGALLVAASPVFLYQLMNPMSDVPVTAAWTVALLFATLDCPLAAGLATAAAIAIRPNLAPLAGVLIVWLAWTKPRAAVVRAAIGIAPAVVGIALLNARLYGSPLASGYGSLGDLYAIANLPVNARLFALWTMQVQTPIVALAGMHFIAPGLIPPERVPAARILFGGTMVVVLGSYLFYRPFDAWWYLRFLLPMWPTLMLLTAAGLEAIVRRSFSGASGPAMAIALIALTVYGGSVASDRYVFAIGRAERRHVDIGRYFAGHTEPGSIAMSMQFSAAIRLYSDRLALRYDLLDPAWLDRAVEQLQQSGRHPYIVLQDFEEAAFRSRFAATSRIGALDWQPIAVYQSPRIAIYDAVRRTNETPLGIAATGRGRSEWRCDPPQIWPPRLRMK